MTEISQETLSDDDFNVKESSGRYTRFESERSYLMDTFGLSQDFSQDSLETSNRESGYRTNDSKKVRTVFSFFVDQKGSIFIFLIFRMRMLMRVSSRSPTNFKRNRKIESTRILFVTLLFL